MTVAAGTRLGPYEIVDLLGTGGMGEVYRARDTRLDRSVALKTLKAKAGPDRRQRFEREARAISALDHPNICPLYDVGRQDDIDFLVMPLLDGETMATRLARGALPIDRAIALAAQIADALDKAHRAGFVHRDLKPANIMLTKVGRSHEGSLHATLLDFGLAKLCDQASTVVISALSTQVAESPNLTVHGTIVGTLQYMSPEQVEGKAVDSRADLFALGTVMYEMLTGRPAFEGDSAASVIAAILEHEPPKLSALQPNVPPGLQSIVRRCLAKSPDHRFQSAADLRFALESLSLHPHEVRASGADPSRSAVGRIWRGAAIAGIGFALAAAVWLFPRSQGAARNVPEVLNPVQVTNALGVEDYPSWSPDGRTLAYAADPLGDVAGGNWDIWVTQVGGSQPLNRTPESLANDRLPTWSPDGQQLAFWSDRDGAGCYVMPALAGSARRVAAGSRTDPNPPAWSSDGSQLACVMADGPDVFAEIHDLRDGQSRRILLAGDQGRRLFLSWSPDLTSFAYIDSTQGLGSDVTQLRVLRLADSRTFAITDGRHKTWSPTWSPTGDAVYFVSNLGGAMDLWRQGISRDGSPSGEPERVTSGIGMRSARLSADGARLAYSQGRRVSNVWRVSIRPAQPGSWAEAQQVTFDQAYIEFLDVSPDGTRLMVTSDRSGNPDIWSVPVDGGEMQPVVQDPDPDWEADWSPDGQMIAFYSYRSGNRDLWVAPINGGAARQLTGHPGTDLGPSWSPEGKNIAFWSNRNGIGIWIVPATGGQPTQVNASAPRYGPRWSPDGTWLAAQGLEGNLWRLSPTNATPEILLARQARKGAWAPDSRSVYFLGSGSRSRRVYIVSTDGTGERLVADFSGRRGSLGDISTDGHSLFFTWEESLGDIWVSDLVSPQTARR